MVHQDKLLDIRNNFKWTHMQLELHMEKPMGINSDLGELQVNIELKWIKCMMENENSKETTLASIWYFICQIWNFN